MPNKFEVSLLMLSGQQLTASGNSLLLNGNPISGGGGGLSQSQADLLYLALSGGEVTGLIAGTELSLSNSNPHATLDISGYLNISHNFNDTDIITATGNTNSFLQLNVVNASTGKDASADIVASNSTSDVNNYVNLGINGLNYTGAYVGFSGDGYIYGQGYDFYVGNATSGKDLYLFAGGGVNSITRTDVVLKSTNRLGIFNNQPAYQVDVSGSGNFSSGLYVRGNPVITGSITSAFTKNAGLTNPNGITSGAYLIPAFRSNGSFTVTGIHAQRLGGSGVAINAYKNTPASSHLAVNMNISSTGTWISSGIITNSSYTLGDSLYISIVSLSGLPTAVSIQVDFV